MCLMSGGERIARNVPKTCRRSLEGVLRSPVACDQFTRDKDSDTATEREREREIY